MVRKLLLETVSQKRPRSRARSKARFHSQLFVANFSSCSRSVQNRGGSANAREHVRNCEHRNVWEIIILNDLTRFPADLGLPFLRFPTEMRKVSDLQNLQNAPSNVLAKNF